MIAFFRRALSSWLVLGLLALIMIAFIVTGIGTPGGLGSIGGGTGGAIATVGGRPITEADVAQRAEQELNRARQQQPAATMAQLLGANGLALIAGQMIDGRALEVWAERQGMGASDRLIDGEIASMPAFAGPTGQFDEQAMRGLLARQGVSEARFRQDFAGDLLRRQLLVPATDTARAPVGMVTPYAALLIERRVGTIALVPSAQTAGPPPTDAAVAAWYKANIARYTLPERRVIRYAAFDRSSLALPAPSEAEIAAAYRADAARYAPRAARRLSRVVLQDQAQARALAARVAAGTPFAAAAAQAGFAAGDIALGTPTRDALARDASPEVAAAAFALPAGGTSAPIRTELGWMVVHVDAIETGAGQALGAVRGAIAKTLADRKAAEALAAMVARIDDAVGDGATFDEVARREKLTVVTTPPLLPNGRSPGFTLDPALAPALKPLFEASADDDPTVETLVPDQRFALVAVRDILPAAPVPLAEAKAAVARDVMIAQAETRARAVADAIEAKVRRGVPMAAAVAEAKLGLPAPREVSARQLELAQSRQPVPPGLAALFTLTPGRSRVLPGPNGVGWFVVRLDRVEPAPAGLLPALVQGSRAEFGQLLANEYAGQFAAATRTEVGVKRDAAALARLAQRLKSGGQPEQP